MAGKANFMDKKLPLVKVLCSFVFPLDAGIPRFETILDMSVFGGFFLPFFLRVSRNHVL